MRVGLALRMAPLLIDDRRSHGPSLKKTVSPRASLVIIEHWNQSNPRRPNDNLAYYRGLNNSQYYFGGSLF